MYIAEKAKPPSAHSSVYRKALVRMSEGVLNVVAKNHSLNIGFRS